MYKRMRIVWGCFVLVVITYFLVPWMLKKVQSFKVEHEFLLKMEEQRMKAKRQNRVTTDNQYTITESLPKNRLTTIITRKTRKPKTRDPYGLLSFNDADV